MENVAQENLRKLDALIKRGKQIIKLDFINFQPICQFSNIKAGQVFDVNGNEVIMLENDESKIIWSCNSLPNVGYPMHFHECDEVIEMIAGNGTLYIDRGSSDPEEIVIKEGQKIKIGKFVSHSFFNKENIYIHYKVTHIK